MLQAWTSIKFQSDPEAFCLGNCSQQLAQALHDCGDSAYTEIISCKTFTIVDLAIHVAMPVSFDAHGTPYAACARDPMNSQFCGAVHRNQTVLANLNASCSGTDDCNQTCQTAIDNVRLSVYVYKIFIANYVDACTHACILS